MSDEKLNLMTPGARLFEDLKAAWLQWRNDELEDLEVLCDSDDEVQFLESLVRTHFRGLPVRFEVVRLP